MSTTNSYPYTLEFLQKEFPTALSSLYSEQQFIEYILRQIALRQAQGDTDLLGTEYTFSAGPNLQVDVTQVSPGVFNVEYSYIETEDARVLLPTISKEFGDEIPIGDQNFTVEVVRGSSPFFSIQWNDVIPIIDEDEASLAGIGQNESFTANVANATAVDGDGTVLATGGVVTTTDGKTFPMQVNISRRTRYYWGVTDDPDNVDLNALQSALVAPSTASVDHGSTYTHFVLFSTADVTIKASGIDIQAVKTIESINSNPNNPTYFKEYKKYVSPGTATGTFDYAIE